MESSEARSWLRCYRCWSTDLEVQVHYEGIHKIDPETGERAEPVDELQEAVVQCLECMHDQPHLGFHNGRVEPIEDRWERMIAGTPWVASCTVAVDADEVESCSGPDAGDSPLLRRLRRARHARVLHPRALPQARRRQDHGPPARRALRPVGRRGHRRARRGRARRAGHHVACRGVAPAGRDRRRRATSPRERARRPARSSFRTGSPLVTFARGESCTRSTSRISRRRPAVRGRASRCRPRPAAARARRRESRVRRGPAPRTCWGHCSRAPLRRARRRSRGRRCNGASTSEWMPTPAARLRR